MSESESGSSSSGCGCFGCFLEILGLGLVTLFFVGACASDPVGTGVRHDFEQGMAEIVQTYDAVIGIARPEPQP